MFGYQFKSVYDLLDQVNQNNIKEVVTEDFFQTLVVTIKQEGWPARALSILERWVESEVSKSRISDLMLTPGRQKKLMLELKEQSELEQEFFEELENLDSLKSGVMEFEILQLAPFSLELTIR